MYSDVKLKGSLQDTAGDSGQFNRYIEYHQRERTLWQRQERQLQEQVENISHDLRTPLTSILGYLELVDGSRLARENQEALERVLHNMIQNALRYARSRFRVCVFYAGHADGEEGESGPDRLGRDAGAGGIGTKRQICLDFSNDTEHLSQEDMPCLFDRFYTQTMPAPAAAPAWG